MAVARRPGARVAPDVGVGLLKRGNEIECDGGAGLGEIPGQRLIDILPGLRARNDLLGLHPRKTGAAALRTRSRRPSK